MKRSAIEVIYEDDDILVVDKPAGMIVHPAPGHEENSMTEALVGSRPSMRSVGSAERPGVVHRLDIDTSGVMVFAKTRGAYLDLRRQFESHQGVTKRYLAVVHGSIRPAAGTISEPVGRDARPAVSHWRVLGRQGSLALVEFTIDTGRTHQIRLHAKSLGHPIVGDALYGDRVRDARLRRRPQRLLLHAVELSFLHPATRRRVTFSAPPPGDIVWV